MCSQSGYGKPILGGVKAPITIHFISFSSHPLCSFFSFASFICTSLINSWFITSFPPPTPSSSRPFTSPLLLYSSSFFYLLSTLTSLFLLLNFSFLLLLTLSFPLLLSNLIAAPLLTPTPPTPDPPTSDYKSKTETVIVHIQLRKITKSPDIYFLLFNFNLCCFHITLTNTPDDHAHTQAHTQK